MCQAEHYKGKKIKRDWRDRIKIGDVLETKSGDLRVVREVTYRTKEKRLVGWISLSIKHCSWTGRCYTVLCRTDLKAREFRPTRKRMALRGSIDREILHNIRFYHPEHQTLTCCDVEGVS